MNFFKSILSDEEPPQPETTNSPSSAPRAGASTSENQLPAPRAAASGAWSFGDLVKTITTRSESVLETYRRDLAEFGSGLRKESDLFREVANNAVKDLPASIDGVMKAISVPEQLSKNSKSESVRNYSRFDSQLDLIQNDVRTYVDDPEDVIEFGKWKLGFVLGERRGEIAEVLKNEKVDAIYREVVGGGNGNGEVDEASFWCRYFYKVWKMREVEDARSKFVRRAVNVDDDEEELSWDVDDDEEEENVVRENDKKPSLDYERENVSSSVDKDIVDEVKPSGSVSDEKVELVTKTDENAGVGSVSDHKEKLQVDEDLEWDEIGDIGENDEKSVLSQGGSLNKDEVLKRLNSGDDDEDLSWDIEDDDEPLNAGKSK